MAAAQQIRSAGRTHLLSSPVLPSCYDLAYLLQRCMEDGRERELYYRGFSALAFPKLVDNLNTRSA